MVTSQPGSRTVIAGRWRPGHEHLEGKLRQRAGGDDEKVLALDKVLHLGQEGHVEPGGANGVEGQWARLIPHCGDTQDLSASLGPDAVPCRHIETAPQRGYLAG